MAAARDWQPRIGQRVVVRYVMDDGVQTDLVGDLTAVDDALHVRSARGGTRIPLGRVVSGKVVPPRPTRPGPPHLVVTVTDLERVMALHWRALETAELGGWLLRASAGITGRGNSALPLGDPPGDATEALDAVRAWYADRGLPAKLSVAGADPAADPRVHGDAGPAGPARDAAVAAGWVPVPDASALVMTARTAALGPLANDAMPSGCHVVLDDEPDDAWLANYRYRGAELPPAALGLLRSAPEQVFVSVRQRDGGRVVAVARGSLAGGWVGLTAVEVIPELRRRGLGPVLLGAVADWGRRAGAVPLFLQVGDSNTTALGVYRAAGLVVHHRYDYLQEPPD